MRPLWKRSSSNRKKPSWSAEEIPPDRRLFICRRRQARCITRWINDKVKDWPQGFYAAMGPPFSPTLSCRCPAPSWRPFQSERKRDGVRFLALSMTSRSG